MELKYSLICALICASYAATVERARSDQLKVSAFNVQVFGKSKMSKPEVVDILVDIITRYDLVLIQEIRDIDQVAFPELVAEVNKKAGGLYGSFLSMRTGRTSSKEQYGFIYRNDKLVKTNSYEYDDANDDFFERDPCIVTFERIDGGGTQKIFNLIPLHAKPDDAVAEMNALVDVYADSQQKTGIVDALITGDLNADCSYVCSSCWSEVTLRQDERFNWLIGDEADTTVSKTDCAYDRIITTGELTANSNAAGVFNFELEYGLSNEEAKDVSDHYPVEFEIW